MADGSESLFDAVADGNVDFVRAFIAAGADVNAVDNTIKYTPLTLAIRNGHDEIARILLEEGNADPNLAMAKPFELTPLYYAVEKQKPEIVRMLLAKKANPTKVVKGHGPPIVYAAKLSNDDIVNQLLAVKNTKGKPVVDVNKATLKNLTALMAACDSPNSSLAVVEALLSAGAGAGINEKYDGRFTALWLAVMSNHASYIGPLVAAGANINERAGPVGGTPLIHAITKGNPSMVRTLVEHGADVNLVDEGLRIPPLILAIQRNKSASANALIDAGADLTAVDPTNNYTSILYAIEKTNLPLIQRILAVPGFDVNHVVMAPQPGGRPSIGLTALIKTLMESPVNTEILNMLIAAGADVNLAPLPTRLAPVMYAGFYGELTAMPVLISAGADINRETADHQSALHLTAKQNHADMVTALLDAGADVRKGAGPGKTVLQRAEAGEYSAEINEAILAKAAGGNAAPALWKGFTKPDIEKLDMIFATEPEGGFAHPPANNYFTCPVCLTYGERATACNYMKHNCTLQTPHYHRGLYNKYKNADGEVGWCCICGRACRGHSHMKLVPHDAPNPGPATDARGDIIQGDPYEVDCRISSGGGGLPEKLARFRAYRETAHLLQAEVDRMPEREARKILIEETWNGPFTKTFVTRRIKGIANWNTPLNAFRNEAATGNAGPAPNIPLPANRPVAELVEGEFMDEVTLDDFTRGVKYTHVQPNGSTQTHISSIRGLINFVGAQPGLMGNDLFARCPWYLPDGTGCNCFIYPEEIRPFVGQAAEDTEEPATFIQELFDRYVERFNEKFRAGVPQAGGRRHRRRRLTRKAGGQHFRRTRHRQQRGGAIGLPTFTPMKDAICVLPQKPKKGGRRSTRSHPRKHRRRVTRRKV